MPDSRLTMQPPCSPRQPRHEPELGADWTYANQLADLIVDVLNAERTRPDFDAHQAIVGQLLALVNSARRNVTEPGKEVEVALYAVKNCLIDLAGLRKA